MIVRITRIVLLVLLSSPFIQQVNADEPVDGYPFQIRLKRSTDRPSLATLLRETEDLRMLFVDRKTIERRIADLTAVLDFGDSYHAFEMKVTPKTTVKDVLDQSPLGGWNRGSQLKLIKRDAIFQTPLLFDPTQPGKTEEFLKMEVSPGDCLLRIPNS